MAANCYIVRLESGSVPSFGERSVGFVCRFASCWALSTLALSVLCVFWQALSALAFSLRPYLFFFFNLSGLAVGLPCLFLGGLCQLLLSVCPVCFFGGLCQLLLPVYPAFFGGVGQLLLSVYPVCLFLAGFVSSCCRSGGLLLSARHLCQTFAAYDVIIDFTLLYQYLIWLTCTCRCCLHVYYKLLSQQDGRLDTKV